MDRRGLRPHHPSLHEHATSTPDLNWAGVWPPTVPSCWSICRWLQEHAQQHTLREIVHIQVGGAAGPALAARPPAITRRQPGEPAGGACNLRHRAVSSYCNASHAWAKMKRHLRLQDSLGLVSCHVSACECERDVGL